MPFHSANLLALGGVPDLHEAIVGADGKVRPSLRPCYGRHEIASKVAKLGHLPVQICTSMYGKRGRGGEGGRVCNEKGVVPPLAPL